MTQQKKKEHPGVVVVCITSWGSRPHSERPQHAGGLGRSAHLRVVRNSPSITITVLEGLSGPRSLGIRKHSPKRSVPRWRKTQVGKGRNHLGMEEDNDRW